MRITLSTESSTSSIDFGSILKTGKERNIREAYSILSVCTGRRITWQQMLDKFSVLDRESKMKLFPKILKLKVGGFRSLQICISYLITKNHIII